MLLPKRFSHLLEEAVSSHLCNVTDTNLRWICPVARRTRHNQRHPRRHAKSDNVYLVVSTVHGVEHAVKLLESKHRQRVLRCKVRHYF